MSDTRSSALDESISALVDGESNEMDLQRVLKSMGENDDSRDVWSRYHLMKSLMAGDDQATIGVDLSSSIRDAIAQEESVVVPSGIWSNWSDFLGKGAVAAAVAFGVVVGAQQYMQSPDVGIETPLAEVAPAASSSGAAVPPGFELPPLITQTVSAGSLSSNAAPRSAVKSLPQGAVVISSDKFQEQVNRLMFKHAEQVSSSGSMGVIPFARVSELKPGEEK